MRKIPGGNSLWNAAKSVLGTASKIQYLTGTSVSQTGGGTNYSRDDSFMVSFNSGAGSYVAPARTIYGNCAARPADPVLAKFEFLGWYTEREGGELFVFELTEITRNITLYARWKQMQATVTYNSRQGSAVSPVTINIGAIAIPPGPPKRQGYEFEYWCTDISATTEFNFSTPITNDITLYARWKVVFTATFNSNGGSAVLSQTVNSGDKIIYPLIPERENYIFGIWCADSGLSIEFDFDTPINSNITLFAKWARVSNNVTFNSNGGTEIPPQIISIGGHAARPPDPVKDGHTFQRWCGDEGLTQEFLFDSVPVNYPITIYARWLMGIYTVHFVPNGGTEIPDQAVNFQELAIYPPVPTKAGALFLQWCSDEELETEFDFSISIIGDLTLYAKWHEGASE